MSYITETKQVGHLTVEVSYDPDPTSPREWDNLGTIVTPRKYVFGDERADLDQYQPWVGQKPTVVFGLEYQDRGSNGCSLGVVELADLDTGYRFAGFIFDTEESRRLIGVGIDAPDEEAIRLILTGEVELLEQYLNGEVYRFAVVDTESGDVLDACSGYYSEEEALAEGIGEAEAMIDHLTKNGNPTVVLKIGPDEVTAGIPPHGSFTAMRSEYDDKKGLRTEVIRHRVERYYRDEDKVLAPNIPHEALTVMYCEIVGPGCV